MPSIAAHLLCAKKVYEKFDNKPDKINFYKGNVLPDSMSKAFHYKTQSKINDRLRVPNIYEFWRTNTDMLYDVRVGYLVHLLLDKYFLEIYLDKIECVLSNKEYIFTPNKIYRDYTLMNYRLREQLFEDKELLDEILDMDMFRGKYPIVDRQLKSLHVIKYSEESGHDTKYMNYERFNKFIEEISIRIVKEVQDFLKENEIKNPIVSL